ncbi:hypothetical protein HYU09_03225 [Candidatus Woesearchaeota archaeon]|nr:hypothetical protein [Candidatus Woesearchaeota archaeon]
MKKRGDLITISVIIVILAVVVALMLPKVAKDKATGVVALKTASARDIALNLNVMCSSPYDMKERLIIGLEGFILEISDNRVNVYDRDYVRLDGSKISGKDPTIASYPFSCQSRINFVVDSPKILVIEKKEGIFSITKENDKAKA